MNFVQKLKNEVLEGNLISKEEALELAKYDIQEVCDAANEIRKHFLHNNFDMCTIINAKSGRCSENCKFCAQSSFYSADVEEYELLGSDKIVEEAKYNYDKGVQRYSLVTSGRRLSDCDIEKVCESVKQIKKDVGISVCASHGLLNEEQFKKLKAAGVSKIHNNLEVSNNKFGDVCTTHTFEDKIESIKAAQRAGIKVCSGGIVGMGETMEDRVDMYMKIRDLGVKSTPVNMLNPIPGTPFGHLEKLTNDEMCQIVAIVRFINPDSYIRLAGGRGLLEDKGRSCFLSGANAAITGDMLTTTGISIDTDKELIKELGYKIVEVNE
ncbi:biotin synthase BioB [Sedimentibacter sp. zth1]|uniref:biotin synthase BioB n=1 Tax=Sedimentibacter sp. zth1 TaxID=2816908 RepID=UPI001A9346C0|nr:biotin synthase BioB [Sedimentibacter sp. zth1]QSX06873.1 biotin synthase BioB [Sedimentibacter sp. zth1]